jgi:hypothetical protein
VQRSIDGGQRAVIPGIGIVALLFQATQDRLERFDRVVGH